MRKILALAVPFVLVVPLSSQLRTESTLTKLSQDFAAAFNAKNSAKIGSFYTDDATLMPPNEPAVKGRSNIEAWFKKELDEGVTNLQLTPTESAIGGEQAFEAGTYSILVKPATTPAAAGPTATGGAAAGGPVTDSGKYVVVLKRIGGEWKIAYDIFNSDLRMQPPSNK